jgi:uncharacterized membrane protein HdeD (DUF308 family)
MLEHVRDESVKVTSVLSVSDQLEKLGRNWGWVLTAGLAYIGIGIGSFMWPIDSTVGLTFALGVLFVVNGVFQLIHAFQLRAGTGNGWRIFQALSSLLAGGLIFRYPEAGIAGIAMAMVFYFFVGAAAKGVMALTLRPLRGWGWTLVSAIASFLLGVFIMLSFPVSALWMPGFIFGMDLVTMGCALVGFSFDLKNFHRKGRKHILGFAS